MNKLIEFNVAGSPVFIESSDEAPAGAVRGAGPGQLVEKIGRSLEETLAVVHPIAEAALTTCRNLATVPDTVEVEFSLKFNTGVNVAIVSASTEGNLRMKLVLKPR